MTSIFLLLLLSKVPDVNRNALEFGVKADGVTNDAPAMQTAINYAINSGTKLLLPSGDIVLNSPLILGNGLTSVYMEGTVGQSGGVVGSTRFVCNMPGGRATACLKTQSATDLAAGALVRVGNTVTVTAQSPHGFRAGQLINLYPGETSFPVGCSLCGLISAAKTVATVPSPNVFTYTEVQANCNPACPNGSSTVVENFSAPNYVGRLSSFDMVHGTQGDGTPIQMIEAGIDLTAASEWQMQDVNVGGNPDQVRTFISCVKLKDTNGIFWLDHLNMGGSGAPLGNGLYITSAANQFGNAMIWLRSSSSGFLSNFVRVDGFALSLFVKDSFVEGADTEFLFSDCGNAYEGLSGGPSCASTTNGLTLGGVYITNNGTNYDRQKPNMEPLKISQTSNASITVTNFNYTQNRNNCQGNGICEIQVIVTGGGTCPGTANICRQGTAVTVKAIAHGYLVGQQVFLSPGETNFPIGYKTVATVPDANTFTYTEGGAAVASTSTENFDSGAFPIRVVANGFPTASNISLLIRENVFAGWRIGVAQVSHSASGPNGDQVLVRLLDNTAQDAAGNQLKRYPDSCASPNVSCTPSELNCINCGSGTDFLFTTHTPVAGTAKLGVNGPPPTATVTLYEGQNFCICTDVTAPNLACSTSVNTTSFVLTLTGASASSNNHTVAYQCF